MSRRKRTRSKPPEAAPAAPSWPADVLCLLLLLALLLFYFQYTTLDKFGAIPPADRYATPGLFWRAVRGAVPLNRADAACLAAILAAGLGLVALELWKGRLTLFLHRAFESDRRALAFLAAASLVSVRFYFARGELSWSADTAVHTSYAWLAARSFSLGEIPIWTNIFGAGSPCLQFYGFLFFYLVGLFDLAFRDFFTSVKIAMAAAHILSGIGMYRLARSLCGSREAGFVAGIAYVLCFWHTQQVLIMGRLPLSLFYALLPWPFYAFERLLADGRTAPAIWGGLALGLLAFTHPGYAFWATALLAVYAAVRLAPLRGHRRFRQTLIHSLLLLAGGAVFGAYLTLPMWLERAHTGLYAGFQMSRYPDPTWRHLLLWSNYRFTLFPLPEGYTHWYGGYLGLSLAALALAATANLFRRAAATAHLRAAGACLALSLLLIVGYRWPVLRTLAVVQALGSVRYLLFVAFFLALLAGAGASLLVPERQKRRVRSRALAAILVLIAIDLGPTTFQHPYIPKRVGDALVAMPLNMQYTLRREAAQYRGGLLPNYRVFYATGRGFRARAISWLPVKTGMPTFLGLYNELPLSTFAFIDPLEGLLNTALEAGEVGPALSGRISAGAHLLNTRYAFGLRAPDPGNPARARLTAWDLPGPTPVVVSSRIVRWSYPIEKFRTPEARTELLEILETMDIDLEASTCDRIPVLDLANEQDLGASPSVRVLEHRVWNQRVEIRLEVSGPCFARLAYAYYPYLGVSVDGRPVRPYRTAGRFIALRLDRGEHRILLEPRLSPLRRALLALDLLLLGAAAFVLYRERKSSTG